MTPFYRPNCSQMFQSWFLGLQWTERRLEIKFDHSLAIAGYMKTTTGYKIKWGHFDMLLSVLSVCLSCSYVLLSIFLHEVKCYLTSVFEKLACTEWTRYFYDSWTNEIIMLTVFGNSCEINGRKLDVFLYTDKAQQSN